MNNMIQIFDTTLRDGEQSPGFSMSISQKLQFARQLKKLNIDVIEAGFPVSSPAQFEAAKAISGEIDGPSIAALARAVEKDITTAFDAIKQSQKPRIHTFIATSPIHMEYKLRKKPDEILKRAVEAVELAKSLCEDVEFSAEDATRSDISFLTEITEAVVKAGATVVNLPDTVGYTVPTEYYKIISEIVSKVPLGNTIISVHCHNDLGLAVANSLSAVMAGAKQVECTINGIGERAGNASLEEIVMALNVRNSIYNVSTNINTKEIYNTSRILTDITGIQVQPNKAIVGKNAFSHESGIHQDGFLKHKQTYEIMTPESIGRPMSEIVLGRHSGKHGFKSRVEALGFFMQDDQLEDLYQKFTALADKKKEVYDDDIISLLQDSNSVYDSSGFYRLQYLSTSSGKGVLPTATIILEKDNETYQEAATGDGPISATYKAIERITGIEVKLHDYHISSVTTGKDAQGKVYVTIQKDGNMYAGHGASTDIIEASALAYLYAINSLLQQKGSTKKVGSQI